MYGCLNKRVVRLALWQEELAASMTEYAFLILFVALATIAGLTALGLALNAFFSWAATYLAPPS